MKKRIMKKMMKWGVLVFAAALIFSGTGIERLLWLHAEPSQTSYEEGSVPLSAIPGNNREMETQFGELFAPGLGNSSANNNIVSITSGAGYEVGAIWTKEKIDFTRSWALDSSMVVTGDGVTIAFQSERNNYIGDRGGNLGVYGSSSSLFDKPKIVIELDSYYNAQNVYPFFGDEKANEFVIHNLFDGYYPTYGTNTRSNESYSFTDSPIGSDFVNVLLNWDATTKTLTATLAGVGTITQTYTEEQLIQLFGAEKKTYMGYTGATGAATGESKVKLHQFAYAGYDVASNIELTHADKTAITDVNPVHKTEVLHVKETLTNKTVSPTLFSIKYRIHSASNLDDTAITNFTVNGVPRTYLKDMLFSGFSYATPIVIEFDIPVKQVETFDEPTSAPKVSYTSVVTSEFAVEVETSSVQGATKNDAPIITAQDFRVIPGIILTNADYMSRANVQASDFEDGTKVSVSVDASAVNLNVGGSYPVLFTAVDQDGKKTTITKNVVVEGTLFTANNVVIDKGTALSNADILTKSNAVSLSAETGAQLPISVSDRSMLNTDEAGVYPVVLTSISSTKTIYVIVKDSNTVIDETHDIFLYGKDFITDKGIALSDSDIVTKAEAKARKLSDGSPVAITIKDRSQLDVNQVGVYPVVLTAGGAEHIIHVAVKDSNTEIDEVNGILLYGLGFISNRGVSLSDADILTHAAAKAQKLSDGSPVAITIKDRSQLDTNTVGVYSVILTAGGVERIIYVTVKDGNTVIDEKNDVLLHGMDFITDKGMTLSNADILTRSEARAQKLSDGSTVAITIKDRSQLDTNKVGVYPVVLTAAGATHTIHVAVKDGNAVIDETNDILLYGLNFTMNKGVTLTDNDILVRAAAKAQKLSDGSTVTVTVQDRSQLNTDKSGVYPVILAASEVTRTIYITVKDSNTVIDETKDILLYGKGFIAEKDITLLEGDILTKSEAKAQKLSDGSAVTVTVKDRSQLDTNTVGVYPVVLTAGGVEHTIYVTITDSDTVVNPGLDILLYGKDFTVDKGITISDNNILTRSEAKAQKLSDGSTVTVTVQDRSQLDTNTVGVYPVVLAAGGVTHTIHVTVKDGNTVIDETNDILLYGMDFTVDKAVVLSDSDILARAQAKAQKLSDGSPVTVTIQDRSQLDTNIVGVYPVVLAAGGAIRTIYVTVNDGNTVIDETKDILLYGKGFIVEKGITLSDSDILTKAEAKAQKISDGSPVTVTIKDRSQLNTNKVGVYPVVLAAGGVEHTIYVTIIDNDTVVDPGADILLYGIDFTVDRGITLSNEDILTQSEAKAQKLSDGSTVSVAIKDRSQLDTNMVGVYPVVLAAGGIEHTIHVVVKDNDTVIDETHDILLYGVDFTVDKGITLSDEDILTQAKAKAQKLSDASIVVVTINDRSQLDTNVVGVYPVVLAAGGVTHTIHVTVKDSNTVIDEIHDILLYGVDFTVDKGITLSNEDILIQSQAKAQKLSDGSGVIVTIQDRSQLDTNAVGVYPVVLGADEVTHTIYVTVKDGNTIIDETHDILLYGVDFTVDKGIVLSDADILTQAEAKAQKLSDGSPVTVTIKDRSQLNTNKVGIYPVILAASGVERTIYVTVKDGNTVIDETHDILLYGVDFTVEKGIVLSDEDILTRAQAKAQKLSDASVVIVTLQDRSQLDTSKSGVYPVVLAAEAVTRTIYITVNDSNTVIDETKDVLLYGIDFTVDKGITLSDEDILIQSQAKAQKLSDGSPIAVIIKDRSQLDTNKVGVYPVVLVANEVTHTIHVTVKDGNTIIDETHDILLYGVDFTVDKGIVLSDEDILTHAQAKAQKLSDGSPVTVTIKDRSQLNTNKVGVYPVILAASEVERTIYVTVKDGNTVIDETHDILLYGVDFTVEKGIVLSDEDILTRAQAKAQKLSDASVVIVTLQDRSQLDTSKSGVYPVVLAAEAVTRTIYITVNDSNTVIDETKDVLLYGIDFTVEKGSTLSNNDILTRAEARAQKLSDGTPIAVIIKDRSQLDTNKVGVYPVILAADGVEHTIYVTVKDGNTVIDETHDILLYGIDFTVDKGTTLSDTDILTHAEAKAQKLSDGSAVDVIVQNRSQLDTNMVGVYSVELAAGEVTHTIYVTVKDGNTVIDETYDILLYGLDFSVDKGVTLTDEDILIQSEAKAQKLSDGSAVVITIQNRSQLDTNVVGVYPVVLAAGEVTHTIYVAVKDVDTVIDETNDILLYGKDFIADKGISLSDNDILTHSQAKAQKLSDGSAVVVTIQDRSQLEIDKAGVYPVVLAAGGTIHTIHVTVKDTDTVIDETHDILLYGKDFITIKGITLSDNDILTRAEARAQKLSDGSVVAVTIQDRNQLNINKAGVYPVVLAAGAVVHTIHVTVKDSNTVVDPEADILLYGKDFTVDRGITLLNEDILTRAEAKAQKLSDGSAVPVTIQDRSQLDTNTVGVYPIVLVAAETTHTIYITVNDNNTVIDETNDILLYGKSFVAEKGITLSDEDILINAEAKAQKISDGSPIIVTVKDRSQLDTNTVGVYPVVLVAGGTTEHTIYVAITDSNTVVEPSLDILLYGLNFQVDKDVMLTDEDILTQSQAKAQKLSDGSTVAVTIQDRRQLDTNTVGVYPVVLAASGVTHTIYVTVKDDNTIIDETHDVLLYGVDFTVEKGITLSDADILTQAEAKAQKLSDGSTVVVTIQDRSQLDTNIVGVYPVVLAAGGVTHTIHVTVKDSNTVIDETQDVLLYGVDFTVDKGIALSDEDILTHSQAKAQKLSDGSGVIVTIQDRSQLDTNAVGVYPVVLGADEVTHTIYITVKDENTVIDETHDVLLYGVDFTVDKGITLSDEDILAQAEAKAQKLSDGSTVAVTIQDRSQLDTNTVGVYPVVLAAGEVTHTIYVTVKDGNTVIDETHDILLYGVDFTVNKGITLSDEDILTRAEAKAQKISDASIVVVTIQDRSQLDGNTVGVYPVVLAAEATTHIVYVTVQDKNTVIDETHDTLLYGVDFTVDKGITLSDEDILTQSEAKAQKISDGSPIVVTVKDRSQLDTNTVGVYPVVLAAEATTHTIYVTVKDGNTVIDETHDILLYGLDFITDKGVTLSDNDILTRAEAKAQKLSDGSPVTVKIKDRSQLNTDTVGVYPVVLAAGATTHTIYVTVKDSNTVIDETHDVLLYGVDFTVDKGITLSDADILTRAEAKAQKLSDASVVSVTIQDRSQLDTNTVGVYPVVLAAGEVTHIVYVTVQDKNTVIDETHDTLLYGVDFTVDKGISLSDADILTHSQAKAQKISDGSPIIVTIQDRSQLNTDTVGVYPVVLAAGEVTHTIYVTVKDGNTVIDPETDTLLYGVDFTVDKGIALSDTDILTRAEAKAQKLSDGSPVTVTIKDRSQLDTNTVGVYPVVLAAGATTHTIYVTVKDENTVIDENEDILLYGVDFTVEKGIVLSDADILTRAEAKAQKLSDASVVSVTIQDRSQLDTNTVGVYPVVLAAGATIHTIYVTVNDGNTVIDETHDILLYGTDFIIDKGTMLTDEDILTRAEAKAQKLSDGSGVIVTIQDRSQLDTNTVGVYPVVLVAGATIHTIHVTVKDGNTVVHPETDILLYGVDFTIDKGITLSDEDILVQAEAKAQKLSDGSPVVVTIQDRSQLDTNTVGVYPVVLAAGEVTHTIYVTVKDGNTVIDETHDILLYGVDFTVDKGIILSDEDILAQAEAKAQKLSDASIVVVTIQDRSQLDTNVIGVYPVVLGAGGVTHTIHVTVKDSNTVIDETQDVLLYGVDFTVDKGITLSDEDILTHSQAKAQKLSDGSGVIVTIQDRSQLDTNTVGVYPVVLAAGATIHTIHVTVKDGNTVVHPETDILLYGVDFTIDKGITLSDEDILAQAEAKAQKLSDGSTVAVTIQDRSQLDTNTVGVYPVVLAAGEVTHTIYVTVKDGNTVIDETHDILLYGVDFTVNKGITLSDEDILAQAEAKAQKLSDGSGVIVTVQDRSQLDTNAVGVYPVVLAAEATAHTIYITVKDENTVVDETHDILLYGLDFITDKGITLSDEEILTHSQAKAQKLSDGSGVIVTVQDRSQLNTDTVGVYPVVLAAGEVTHTIHVTVKDGNTVIDETHDILLYGLDFITDKDVPLSDEDILIQSEAKAQKLSDGSIVSVTIQDRSQLDVNKVGVYPVVLAASGTTHIIHVTVKDTNTIIDETHDVLLYGVDFTVDKGVMLSDEDILTRAEAKAQKLSDGSGVIVTIQDRSQLDTNMVGVYSVELAAGEVTHTIYITVKDDNTVVNPEEDILLYGLNFITDKDVMLSDEDILTHSQAKAQKLSDGSGVIVTVQDRSQLNTDTVGVYPVVLAAGEVTRTIYITVKDSNTVIEPGADVLLYGLNFIVDKDATLSDKDILTRAEAKAQKLSDGSTVAVTIQDRSKLDTNVVGVYPVVLAAGEVTRTIYITVKDSDTIIDETNGILLYGSDFKSTKGVPLSDEDILTRAQVKAQKLSDGSELGVIVRERSSLNTDVVGQYSVVLEAIQKVRARAALGKTQKTINIEIIDIPAEVIPSSGRLTVTGEDMKLLLMGIIGLSSGLLILLVLRRRYN